jgi:uncharacterized protein YxeA
MKKTSIIMIVILLVISCVSYYLYNCVLYKEERNIQNEKPEFSVTASDLDHDFVENALKAYSKYSNKTMEIEGKVTEVTDSTLVLDRKIFCKMNEKMTPNFMNKQVNIKGRCIGYDDLFEVVKFDQCNKQ